MKISSAVILTTYWGHTAVSLPILTDFVVGFLSRSTVAYLRADQRCFLSHRLQFTVH